MSFNQDTFSLMLKFAGAMVAVLLLIWLLALITPHAAKLIDKLFGRVNIDRGASAVPNPERVDGENKDGEYRVYDIYDGCPPDNEEDKK